jgi:hypothetical protein
MQRKSSYQLFSVKIKALESSHGLGAGLYVAEDNVPLPSHLCRLHDYHVKDRTVCGKQSIEREPKIGFLEFVGQVFKV